MCHTSSFMNREQRIRSPGQITLHVLLPIDPIMQFKSLPSASPLSHNPSLGAASNLSKPKWACGLGMRIRVRTRQGGKLAVPPLPSLAFPCPLSLPFCTHLITRLRSISSASPTSSVSLHHHHHRHHHRLCRALIVEVYFNCQPQRRLFAPAVALPLFASLVYLFTGSAEWV